MIKLDDVEARVLGSLVEKAVTTPEAYPLSYNSLLLACNQKTSREPVMNLDESTAGPALHTLTQKELVERVHETGSRVPKFRHRVDKLLASEDPRVTAVICVLLLRGPQTPGELKTRTERLCKFESTAEVDTLLSELANRPEPIVAKLPRQPGQKEARWRQLFTGEAPAAETSSAPAVAAAGPVAPAAKDTENRVAALEKKIEDLEARLAELEKRPHSLPSQVNQ